jgi:hypothetical protein
MRRLKRPKSAIPPVSKVAPAKVAFRKYTNLAALIHLLQTRTITLLDPSTWDDKNDAWFMKEFQDITGASTVLAICFAESEETYHHWRVFAPGADGVCIEFDKDAVLSAFDGTAGIRRGPVQYRLIDTLRRRTRIEPEELPFLKRRPYQPECEYRVIYIENGGRALKSKSFPIQLDWIKRITLSPWMTFDLRDAVAKTLNGIPGCRDLKVARSTLVGNREWQSLTEKARPAPGKTIVKRLSKKVPPK